MKNVFISYNTLDSEDAVRVRDALESHEISCWMAPRDIPFGYNYTQVIPKAIASCPILIVIMSRNTQNSVWIPKELRRAINTGSLIIPFMLENVKLNDEFSFLIEEDQRCYAYTDGSIPETLYSDIKGYISK